MATIRIHEDQENQRPEGRNKMHAVGNGGNQHQKRAVLGVLDSNRHDDNIQPLKGKQRSCSLCSQKNMTLDFVQEAAKRSDATFSIVSAVSDTNSKAEDDVPLPLGHSNINNIAMCRNKENWGLSQKEISRKNIVNPIIPVAQFEAFKVYEDEEKLAKIEEKLKAKSTSNVYKGTAEDRFYTKTEVAELERKGIIPPSNKHDAKDDIPSPIPSPMSVEKNFENEYPKEMRRPDKDDFFAMKEYSVDIYRYLRERELQSRAKPGYMKKQPDVTAVMRSILVDWLVEVAEEYKLHSETLYLAVNYIDRFLSYMSVVRAKLQLVGTAAMFLASKYEEIYPPDIGEFVYITDDTYTKRQVIRMEHLIVKVLGFELSVATPLSFITSICSMNKIEEKTKFLAMYLCELSMLEGETYLEFLPSTLAASAIAIAQHTLDEEVWGVGFSQNTGYELEHLKPCVEFLHRMFVNAPNQPQHAIQDKYKSQKHLHVSQLTPKMENFILKSKVKLKEETENYS